MDLLLGLLSSKAITLTKDFLRDKELRLEKGRLFLFFYLLVFSYLEIV